MTLSLTASDYAVLLTGTAVLFIASLLGRKGSVRKQILDRSPLLSCAVTVALLLIVVIFGAYGIGYDASQFIYNQF